jgi:hypothetical protein
MYLFDVNKSVFSKKGPHSDYWQGYDTTQHAPHIHHFTVISFLGFLGFLSFFGFLFFGLCRLGLTIAVRLKSICLM